MAKERGSKGKEEGRKRGEREERRNKLLKWVTSGKCTDFPRASCKYNTKAQQAQPASPLEASPDDSNELMDNTR